MRKINFMSKSDKIKAWLLAHPLIKKNRLLTEMGIDAGAATRLLYNGKDIPDKYVAKIEKTLSAYGYK